MQRPFPKERGMGMRIVLWLTLGFGAACAIAAYYPEVWLYLIVAAVLLLLSFVLLGKKRKRSAAVFLLVLAGLLLGLVRYGVYDRQVLSPSKTMDGFTGTVTIKSTDYSYATDYGSAVEGTMFLQGKSCRVKVYLNGETVTPGDRIYGTFRMRYTAFGGKDDPTFHKGKGIFLLAYPAGDYAVTPLQAQNIRFLPAYLSNFLEERIYGIFPADTAAFANALLLGSSDGLDYDTLTDFSVTGIRHVIAVSGLHVAMLFSFLEALTRKRRLPTLLIGTPVLLLFAAMAGFTPSVVRACIMQFMVLLSIALNREYDTLTALASAVLVMLAVNPLTVTSLSFQLSVASMAGILLFSARISHKLLSFMGGGKGKGIKARLIRWISASVGVSLGAMVFTTPLAAAYFHTVSLIGFLSNLLTLWLISFVFCGIIVSCLLSLMYWPLGSAAAWLVSLPIRFILFTADWLAKIPYAAVYTQSVYIVAWLVFCYMLFAVFLLCKRKRVVSYCAAMFAGFVLAVAASRLDLAMDHYRVTMLNVGQGQCILLQADGRTYMVDCGGDYGEDAADLAAQTILSQGIFHLDGMILTHFDDDHSGGAAYFLSRMPTDLLVLPNMPNEDGLRGKKTVCGAEDMTISYEDTKITVFSSDRLDSSNESSLCVLFQTENCDILITGDRDALGELELLQSAQIPRLDILVAGHHGAETSTSAALLRTVQPGLVLISVGEDNRYGHPSAQTLQRIEDSGAVVRRTDQEGTIIIRG